MNYKWLLPVGAFVLLCFLFLINDNSDDDYQDEVSEFVDTEQREEEMQADAVEPIVLRDINEVVAEDETAKDNYVPVTITHGVEIPVGGLTHGVYASHVGYALSYDTINHCPYWVAWELTKEEAQGRHPRMDEFRCDPQLPYKHQVNEDAFKGTGYDRGHMCPAGDQKWSAEAMSESFFMSNMCPQSPTLNQVWWEHLEEAERRWAVQEGSVYIVCGPIFNNHKASNFIEGNIPVGIPDGFFKVFLSLRKSKEKAIGFIFKNDDSRQPVGKAACSVDHVEEVTGYDFFSSVEDELEAKLESQFNMGKWN